MAFDPVSEAFMNSRAHDCAARTFSLFQRFYYTFLILLLLALLFYRWDIFVLLLSAFFMTVYFCSGFQKVLAALLGLFGGVARPGREELAGLRTEDLPVYSIFLPVYREGAVLPKLIDGIKKLDYPMDRLDVKLLLESDDEETAEALSALELPECIEVLRMPPEQPHTKPRACNYALAAARGEFCVIYDAEDVPEPDQLRRAVAVFRRASEAKTICLQARLCYYNSRRNLLTRLFSIEYATTFFLFLPGLSLLRAPLPLGGTSNHFRAAALRELGGWDPFNVTEDCDLGMRIGSRRFRTRIFESNTYEEANSRIGNFLRQRSRWVKGFMQTHLVYARHPLFVVRNFGLAGAFQAYLTVGGSALMMLSNLICWPLLLLYIWLLYCGVSEGMSVAGQLVGPVDGESAPLGIHAWPLFYIGPEESPFWSWTSIVFGWGSILLLGANLLLVGVGMLSTLKSRQYHLFLWCLLLPLYWVLISLGAWKGAWQLFTKPFYWEKTTHGLG